MAIIRYTKASGESTPAGITDAGYFPNTTQDVYVGIGQGVGTELDAEELMTYVKSLHASVSLTKLSVDNADPTARDVALNNTEVEELVTRGCRERDL